MPSSIDSIVSKLYFRNMSSDVPGRPLTDPRALRALTHPTRLALLEMLRREGPLTATQAGELLGESPASCSFHLRTLARYGFVEEAEGGHGRQRPWRASQTATTIDDDALTPEGRIAAQALVDLLHEREQEWLRRWSATHGAYPLQWRAASTDIYSVRHLTADELREVSELLGAIAARHADREPPPGALPVAVVLHAFPLRPPTEPPPAGPAGTARS
jgi:DNA-binding transcriptional ArsR family regulator